jgi:hypothetical protein
MALNVQLTEAEGLLVGATSTAELAALDEDDLLELHARIRRARNKYTGIYRRQGATKVGAQGGRGKAHGKNTLNRDKAEVFEQALARVSTRLAAEARRSAQELKSERIATARAARNDAPPSVATRPVAANSRAQRSRPEPSSAPSMQKRFASTKATGARRQAKKDSR